MRTLVLGGLHGDDELLSRELSGVVLELGQGSSKIMEAMAAVAGDAERALDADHELGR